MAGSGNEWSTSSSALFAIVWGLENADPHDATGRLLSSQLLTSMRFLISEILNDHMLGFHLEIWPLIKLDDQNSQVQINRLASESVDYMHETSSSSI